MRNQHICSRENIWSAVQRKNEKGAEWTLFDICWWGKEFVTALVYFFSENQATQDRSQIILTSSRTVMTSDYYQITACTCVQYWAGYQ